MKWKSIFLGQLFAPLIQLTYIEDTDNLDTHLRENWLHAFTSSFFTLWGRGAYVYKISCSENLVLQRRRFYFAHYRYTELALGNAYIYQNWTINSLPEINVSLARSTISAFITFFWPLSSIERVTISLLINMFLFVRRATATK